MQSFKPTFPLHCDADRGGETFRLTLCGPGGTSAELELDGERAALLKSRFRRSFYVRCKKEKILYDVENAGSYAELEAIAKKYSLCDVCGFGDVNLYGAKRALKVIVGSLYRYPGLRSKLCFIGTHDGYEKILERIERGDADALKDFGLQYVCTEESAKALGKLVHGMLSAATENHENYVATAVNAFGLFDAVLLDANDFNGYSYLQVVSDLRRSAADGFHPKGCGEPESVVYHELGHLMDGLCGLEKDPVFRSFYDGLGREQIEGGLSRYAFTSPGEFIAEAFAEFMCDPAPRPIAKTVGELIDAAYERRSRKEE